MAQTTDREEPERPPASAPGEPKKLKFPTAFTVLAAVLLLVWVASFFVPAGAYKIDPEDGGPGARHLPRAARRARTPRATSCASRRRSTSGSSSCGSRRRTASTGSRTTAASSAPTRPGALYGSAMIFLFVLAVGAFITVTMKTERDPDRDRPPGAALPAQRLGADRDPDGASSRSAGRATGCGRRRSGFFVLLVPLTLALGYDRHGRRVDHLPRRRHRACCARP